MFTEIKRRKKWQEKFQQDLSKMGWTMARKPCQNLVDETMYSKSIFLFLYSFGHSLSSFSHFLNSHIPSFTYSQQFHYLVTIN